MKPVEDLLGAIFEGSRGPLVAEFEDWLRGSRRFRAFVTEYESKIRSKVRQAGVGERLRDVRAELETAWLLLGDRRMELAYEQYAQRKRRGPDFTVTYRVNTLFNVEVRRLALGRPTAGGPAGAAVDGPGDKLLGVLCEKAAQMPPSAVNLLWLALEAEAPGEGDAPFSLTTEEIARAVAELRGRAERKEQDYFRRRRFRDAAEFLRQLRLLSGVVLWQEQRPLLWLQKGARHELSGELQRAVEGLGRG